MMKLKAHLILQTVLLTWIIDHKEINLTSYKFDVHVEKKKSQQN